MYPELIDCVSGLRIEQSTTLPSSHVPLTVVMNMANYHADIDDVLRRANELDSHAVSCSISPKRIGRKQIRMRDVNSHKFSAQMAEADPPEIADGFDVATVINKVNSILYSQATSARLRRPNFTEGDVGTDVQGCRWDRLLKRGDSRHIWNAIGWNGRIDNSTIQKPTDVEFQDHFEKLLNPMNTDPIDCTDMYNVPYMPVTDDPITPLEVEEALRGTKGDKSGGTSGVPPGLLKLLPQSWLIFFASLFSWIFSRIWSDARLV